MKEEPIKLTGNLSVAGVVMITASSVTPASSIFVIAPLAITSAGSGALISFAIAAGIALCLGLCYAELGAAHPSAGGEYIIIKRLFGNLSAIQMYLFITVGTLFIPAVLAVGAIPYLNTALGAHFSPSEAGVLTVLVGGACGLLNIRSSALLTGFFLVVEIAVLLIIAWLGLTHPNQPATIFTAPRMLNGQGLLSPVPLAAIIAMTGTALFSYNGYGSAVAMAEDMPVKGKPMAKAIMLTLLVVVIVEIVPFSALLIGAPSLKEMAASADPVSYILRVLGGPVLARVVSAAIYLSVFNAIIATAMQSSRVIFSSGRDNFWFTRLNQALCLIGKRNGSPWFATLLFTVISAMLAFSSDLEGLTSFTVILLLLVYVAIAAAALISRRRQFPHPYLMPLWPLQPLLALLFCLWVLWTLLLATSLKDYLIVLFVIALGVALWIRHRQSCTTETIQGE
ncbi:APC family permease [Pantoea coffeiphila]|uniref:APC family permease n=1 Tax=Pantoea coffeiphila TaxID=1465635 RepID=UPI0019611D10|nr:APC family permease [Pantoea coffeiphila]MBM7344102.1 amino acid transporter [Pantoea coffeiphila]